MSSRRSPGAPAAHWRSAVSLNRDRLAGHPALHSQAMQTLVQFLLPLFTSMVLVIPGTPATHHVARYLGQPGRISRRRAPAAAARPALIRAARRAG